MFLFLLFYLFNSVDGVALGGDGDTEVVVVVSVLEEATILFVLTWLLRVCHGEEVILADEPIAQTTVLHNCWKRKNLFENFYSYFYIIHLTSIKHRWFSGRMLACHAGGPGSIPGRCNYFYLVLKSSNQKQYKRDVNTD